MGAWRLRIISGIEPTIRTTTSMTAKGPSSFQELVAELPPPPVDADVCVTAVLEVSLLAMLDDDKISPD